MLHHQQPVLLIKAIIKHVQPRLARKVCSSLQRKHMGHKRSDSTQQRPAIVPAVLDNKRKTHFPYLDADHLIHDLFDEKWDNQ